MATLKIEVEISETDQNILNDQLRDINEWVQNAVIGKINYSWKIMHPKWTEKLMNDSSFNEPIPSNKDDFIKMITSRSDYKTQKQKDDSKEGKIS